MVRLPSHAKPTTINCQWPIRDSVAFLIRNDKDNTFCFVQDEGILLLFIVYLLMLLQCFLPSATHQPPASSALVAANVEINDPTKNQSVLDSIINKLRRIQFIKVTHKLLWPPPQLLCLTCESG